MEARNWSKKEVLAHWQTLDGTANPLAEMEPISYKRSGSTYGECGIRIDGTPEFIDAVLGKLRDLLDGENVETRLNVSRRAVTPTLELNGKTKEFTAGYSGTAEVCYVRLAERGSVAQSVPRAWEGAEERIAASKRVAKLARR